MKLPMQKNILLNPDATEGGENTPPTGTPPPAAAIVNEGKTEREVNLEKELEASRQKISEIDGELVKMKSPPAPEPTPTPAPKRRFGFFQD